jgi:hypothetical protein
MESSSTTISVMHKGQFVTALDYASGDSDNADAQAQALMVGNEPSNSPPHVPHHSSKLALVPVTPLRTLAKPLRQPGPSLFTTCSRATLG